MRYPIASNRSLGALNDFWAVAVAVAPLAAAFGACAADVTDDPSTVDGKADDGVARATLEFTGDYEERLTGAIEAGRELAVVFDPARVGAQCNGSRDGSPDYSIAGYYSVDGGEAVAFPLTDRRDGSGLLTHTLSVPDGAYLQFWFEKRDFYQCVAYDSDFGLNYAFTIGDRPQPSAIVSFTEGEDKISGTIRPDSDVIVRYDLDRIEQCATAWAGNIPQWGITGWFQVDDGAPEFFEVAKQGAVITDDDGPHRVETPARIHVGRGAKVSFWFESNDVFGCHWYDSNYGSNFSFDIVE